MKPRSPADPGQLQVYFASGNAHKVEELRALAAATEAAVELHSAKEVGGMPPVEEDTGTFLGNAQKKARALKPLVPAGAWVLSDDSGICVEALRGAPGVDSAYYAGPQGDAAANRRKLIAALASVPESQRQAHFHCQFVLIAPAGAEHTFTGRCDGHLITTERGPNGFGYDPLFIPSGHTQTLAELPPEGKNHLSHRAKAWTAFANWLKSSVPSIA